MKKFLGLVFADPMIATLALTFAAGTVIGSIALLGQSCENASKRHHEREVLRLQLEASARAPQPPCPATGAP